MDKKNAIDSFYELHYRSIMGTGLVALFWAIIHKQMERPFQKGEFARILEIGAGNGEHIPFVKCGYQSYLATDLRIENLLNIEGIDSRVEVSVQDAEQLKLPEDTFDRVIVTCLLAHLDRPEVAISEIRRVVKKKTGFVTIYLPCEPGIFLRMVRNLSTHLKARRRGVENISSLHYLEHRNYFLALDHLIKLEFSDSQIKMKYRPFPFLTWNSNLYRIYQISKVL